MLLSDLGVLLEDSAPKSQRFDHSVEVFYCPNTYDGLSITRCLPISIAGAWSDAGFVFIIVHALVDEMQPV
jgi:hypothetical protein